MTVPKGVRARTQKVADMLRDIIPQFRHRLTPDEERLGIHLRGNQDLYEALSNLILSRIEGRAKLPEPSDPVVCKSMLAKDRELEWVLLRLEFVYRSPALKSVEDHSEPPA